MTTRAIRISKWLFKGIINSMGMDVVRRTATNGPVAQYLEQFIEYDISKQGLGAIIQVGANDGTMDDPVHKIIQRMGLPAILIEPLPDLFEKLKDSYANCSKVRFENCAIGSQPGTATIYRVRKDADHLPEWSRGIASFDKNVILKHGTWDGLRGKNLDRYIETLQVPVMTLPQIATRHVDIGRIAVLQVDTEGHDYVVVKSAIEGGLTPPIINYEHKHLKYSDQEACRNLLERRGYTFLTTTTDTLAHRAA